MNLLKAILLLVFGGILPWFRFKRIYLNRDFSLPDTGETYQDDERGPVYTTPLCFEWLGFCVPCLPSRLYDTETGLPLQ